MAHLIEYLLEISQRDYQRTFDMTFYKLGEGKRDTKSVQGGAPMLTV